MKKMVIVILIALVACTAMYVTFKRDFDQFNPLYKEQYMYAVINEPGKTEGKNEWIRYRYNLTGYTGEGKKGEITFSSEEKREQGIYVRALAKGAYTKEWSIVQENEIPEKALNQLRSQ